MAWKSALEILNRLTKLFADWWARYQRKQDYEERQEKRDELADDPGAAFRDHFGDGVQSSNGEDRANDATETSKANSGNPGKP